MLPGFEALVEERIKKAQKEGQFDNLEGANKPLKFEDQQIPEEYRMAYKILKNSGFLPPEVALRKKVEQVELLLDQTPQDSEKRAPLQKKLNFLLTKLSLKRGNTPVSAALAGTYQNNLLNKIS